MHTVVIRIGTMIWSECILQDRWSPSQVGTQHVVHCRNCNYGALIWGVRLVRQMEVSRAGTSDYIPQILWKDMYWQSPVWKHLQWIKMGLSFIYEHPICWCFLACLWMLQAANMINQNRDGLTPWGSSSCTVIYKITSWSEHCPIWPLASKIINTGITNPSMLYVVQYIPGIIHTVYAMFCMVYFEID